MSGRLERRFAIAASGTSLRREVLAGVTTYLAMSYIILVNPRVLAGAGMDSGAVMVATCLASAAATVWMGLHANYPIGLAPGMGHNFFFAITVCGPIAAGGLGYPWQAALAAVFVSGCLFIVASFWEVRARIVDMVPGHLKTSIAVGIGLLIAMVGLRWGGLLVATPGTYIGLGDLGSPPVLLTLFGLLLTAWLTVARVTAALVVGILATATVAVFARMPHSEVVGWWGYFSHAWESVKGVELVGLPPSMAPTFLAMDFGGLFRHSDFLSVVFVFLFVDLFDTVGTLIGVGQRAGLLVKGRLLRARQAFLADAVGTVAGAAMGTSTVTSYVESAAGVAAGGRTGLAALVTSGLMAGSIFFYPLVELVGGGYDAGGGLVLYPALAPALIMIGVFMMQGIGLINWSLPLEAIPAFLTMVMMPLTTSITEGIAFGFISTSVLYLASGRARSLHWGVHLIAGLFLLRYIVL
ncbi:MAG: NCS2 family permease [Acidobacteriota bacterium]